MPMKVENKSTFIDVLIRRAQQVAPTAEFYIQIRVSPRNYRYVHIKVACQLYIQFYIFNLVRQDQNINSNHL